MEEQSEKPTTKELTLPELSLVLMIGASGSGKSTFAQTHFKPTEVVSSDTCRGMVSDDENNQQASKDAFDLLHFIVKKRLQRGLLTVVDATNLRPEDRQGLLKLAKQAHFMTAAIVLDLPEKLCQERNQRRPNRSFGEHVVRGHCRQLKRSLRHLKKEGFRYLHILNDEAMIEAATLRRQPMWTNRQQEKGPFDLIGDVHGCFSELTELLENLGYQVQTEMEEGPSKRYQISHPAGRRVFFVGDLVDRGPQSNEVLRLAMDMVEQGVAFCVPGNHEAKLLRKLRGKNVTLTHGLAETLQQLEEESDAFLKRVESFIDSLISHFVLDGGNLVVAHAGMKEEYQGRGSSTVRQFALYGETTGETDERGLPIRFDWAQEYEGRALVVYGHTPTDKAEFFNNTICLDTGCVFGGQLTALRYPEKALVSVDAHQCYYESILPLETTIESSSQSYDRVLPIEDIQGKRFISTVLFNNIRIGEPHAATAVELMARFAVNPAWLNYLPPTMSPSEISRQEAYLEYPTEAFEYFRKNGVPKVICQEKHMGSRAIVQVCRNVEAAQKTFSISAKQMGMVYTRTGRPFFNDSDLAQAFLERISKAIELAGVWEKLQTDWLTLDCELMPWSMKATELIKTQYAAVGASSHITLRAVNETLVQAAHRGIDVSALQTQYNESFNNAQAFRKAYQNYCWAVNGIEDLKLAPFHVMASEGATHWEKDHLWHMEIIQSIVAQDPQILQFTDFQVVDLESPEQLQQATEWWLGMTQNGGEGMVVKPLSFIAKTQKSIVQPALKVRGKEYLRIIYGLDYTHPHHLKRLKNRALGMKRRLALREFALGLEALKRFVQKNSLRQVHECVFGVLAMASEPTDPRL